MIGKAASDTVNKVSVNTLPHLMLSGLVFGGRAEVIRAPSVWVADTDNREEGAGRWLD